MEQQYIHIHTAHTSSSCSQSQAPQYNVNAHEQMLYCLDGMFTMGANTGVAHICDPKLQGRVLRKNGLKCHLPEERGIPCRFLDVLAFPDTHLRSQVGVHLSFDFEATQ